MGTHAVRQEYHLLRGLIAGLLELAALSIVAVLLITTRSAYGAEPNLVQNGGFATSIAGWTVNTNPSWSTAWDAGSARVTWIGPETRQGYTPLYQTGIPVTAGVTYDFGVTISQQPGAPPGGAQGGISVWLLDPNEQPLAVPRVTTGSAGERSLSGRFTVPAGATHARVNLEMQGSSGQTSAYDDVFLRAASPSATFNAVPDTIAAGGATTLDWSTVNAPSVSIDHGLGAQSANGSVSVRPPATTTYTLTATGAFGTVTRQVTVTVVPPPSVTFTVTPTSIAAGQTSTLSWTTMNASAVSIDRGIGAQPLSGSFAVSPNATTTYTLTATGVGGNAKREVTVTVAPPRPQITFSASPRTIAEGEPATLAWSVLNATAVSIDQGIGNAAPAGSAVIVPKATTTYRLDATGPGGTASAQVTVAVLPAPVIVFTATPDTIIAGQTATLTWTATDATLVMIDNDIGAQAPSGAHDVRPVKTVTYVLTASGPGGVRVAQATITVRTSGRRRSVRH